MSGASLQEIRFLRSGGKRASSPMSLKDEKARVAAASMLGVTKALS